MIINARFIAHKPFRLISAGADLGDTTAREMAAAEAATVEEPPVLHIHTAGPHNCHRKGRMAEAAEEGSLMASLVDSGCTGTAPEDSALRTRDFRRRTRGTKAGGCTRRRPPCRRRSR